uniref:O-methyltransferase CTB2 ) n=1 Tax=Ganoderma boninense TaxID=34458 RepID=A0A5K1JYD2_9APHY|nr:O-methyltransferase CTB2 (EC (Cercosporin toxin biosynthesis cluster protein 2) [Ganoderma boninense]
MTSRRGSEEMISQGKAWFGPSQEKKPPGVTALDPYAFDVYCTGTLTQFILRVGAIHGCRREGSLTFTFTGTRSSRSARDLLPLGSFGDMRSG